MQSLDEYQKQAVQNIKGPVLVCAGPGSGKTRTLIRRTLYLLDQKVKPEDILVLTFTNKAAREIKERIAKLVKGKRYEVKGRRYKVDSNGVFSPSTFHLLPFIGTIHSLCLRILKKELGTTPLVISDDDQLDIIRLIKDKLKIRGKVQKIGSQISNFKNKSISELPEGMERIYTEYQKFLKENDIFDYDELQIRALEFLQKSKYNSDKYVLVDEYQDINKIQAEIIKILSYPSNNLFVIGDADQAIYGFRGASLEFFLDFQKIYKNAKIIKLPTNYRSTSSIVNASKSLIKHNKKRISNDFKSISDNKTPIKIIECSNEKDEAKYISGKIEEIIGGTTLLHIDSDISDQTKTDEFSFSDFAVLYRTNSFAKNLEQELEHRAIPYQTVGVNNFWQLPEIQEALAILKYLAGNKNLKTILKKKFDPKVLEAIDEKKEFKEIISSFYEGNENIERFLDIIEDFTLTNYEELVSRLSLLSRETYIDHRANCVKLMTFHQAKGLEFDNVFIAGCEENSIPLMRKDTDLEEERRLFYVGMTRARRQLFLTYAKNRLIWGERERRKPSRFLEEIDSKFVKTEEFLTKAKKKDQIKLF